MGKQDRWLRVTYARPEDDIRMGMAGAPDGILVGILEFAPRTEAVDRGASISILQEALLCDDTDWIRGLPTDPGLHEGWICVGPDLANYHEPPNAWWEPVTPNAPSGGRA